MSVSRATSKILFLAPARIRAIQDDPLRQVAEVAVVDRVNQAEDTDGDPQRIERVATVTRTTTTSPRRHHQWQKSRIHATIIDNRRQRRTSTWWAKTRIRIQSVPLVPQVRPVAMIDCMNFRSVDTMVEYVSVTCPTMHWPLRGSNSSGDSPGRIYRRQERGHQELELAQGLQDWMTIETIRTALYHEVS